jgi:hypothetical protein
MVAVVSQRQADRQTLSGCILPERKPKAVKLLFTVMLRVITSDLTGPDRPDLNVGAKTRCVIKIVFSEFQN